MAICSSSPLHCVPEFAGAYPLGQILKGKLGERIYLTITIPNGFTILLHGQKRQKTSTLPGLPLFEQTYDQEWISPSIDNGIIGQTQRSLTIHRIGHLIGI